MATTSPKPAGRETSFAENGLIVRETDARGRVTHEDEVFLRISEVRDAGGRNGEMERLRGGVGRFLEKVRRA